MTDRITVHEAWRGITPGCGKCKLCLAEAHWSKRTRFPDGERVEFFCDAHKPFVKFTAQPLPWDQVAPAEHEPGCSCYDCLESEWADADGAYRTGRDELDHAQRP